MMDLVHRNGHPRAIPLWVGAGQQNQQLATAVQDVGHPLVTGRDRCRQDHLGQEEPNRLQVPRISGSHDGRL
jgi:hypothetical protein